MEYFWSFELDKEMWNGGEDSVEKCIKEAKEWTFHGEFIYVGYIDAYKPSVSAEIFVERLIDNAYSNCGECSQAWLGGVSANNYASLEKKLNKAVYEWLEEIDEMPFFGEIANIKKYDLETGEIVKEARR